MADRPVRVRRDHGDEESRPVAVHAHLAGWRPVPSGSGGAVVLWRNRRALERAGYHVRDVELDLAPAGGATRETEADAVERLTAVRGRRSRGWRDVVTDWRRARDGRYPPTWPWELVDPRSDVGAPPHLVLSENVQALALASSRWPQARHVVTIHDDDVALEGAKARRRAQDGRGVLRAAAVRGTAELRFALRRSAHAHLIRRCETVVVLGHQLAARYRRWCPRVEVVPGGVPDPGGPVPRVTPTEHLTLLYVGKLHNSHTLVALPFLVEHVLPRVVEAAGDALCRVRVVGRCDGQEDLVRRLEGERVEFVGYVQDLRPEYAWALCQVVPPGLGTGLRVKILESLAHGVPVVTSLEEASAIGLREGEGCLLARTAEEFAAAVSTLARDPAQRAALAKAGRAAYEQRYSPDVTEPRLASLLAPRGGAGDGR